MMEKVLEYEINNLYKKNCVHACRVMADFDFFQGLGMYARGIER